MTRELQFSPFTANVFARGSYAERGAALPVQRGGSFPFDRVPLFDASASGGTSKPYQESAWVLRAIKEIAGPIQAVPLKFTRNEQEITDAPWLPFWAAPARNLPLSDFIEALVGWLKLSGEAFLILQPEYTVPFRERIQAWPKIILARPDSMRLELGADGEPLRWTLTGAQGKSVTLPPEQVVHPRYWNPYNEWRGLSEFEAARVATDADYLAGKFALNMARANGDTGVIVSVKNGTPLDDAQRSQITDALRLKQAKSAAGQFSSIFVPADLEVQDPKVRVPDASFVSARLQNRHEIYAAFGVPMSMADIVASYSIGSASDLYRLITGTCMATATKVADAISRIASIQAGEPVEAYFDFDEHVVMQQVRRERIDAGTKLFDRGVPWRDVSEYLDLDLPRFEGDTTGYIPIGLAPAGEAAVSEPMPDATQDDTFNEPAEEPIAEMLQALRSDRADARQRAAKESLWLAHMRRRETSVRLYQSRCSKLINAYRVTALRRLDVLRTNKSAVTKGLTDILFSAANFGRDLIANLQSPARQVLQTAGSQLMEEIGKKDPWTMPPDEALRFINSRQGGLEKVAATCRGQLNTAIEAALNEGKSIDQIADDIRGTFNNLAKFESKRIARTETAAAYGQARGQAMRDAGVQLKSWLSSHGPHVRYAHKLAEEQYEAHPIPLNQPFIVGGEELMHPGDPAGSPENIINCQCVQLAVAPEEP